MLTGCVHSSDRTVVERGREGNVLKYFAVVSFVFIGKDVMTVRRYSVSSQLSDMTLTERQTDRMRSTDSGWRRLKEEFQLRNHGFSGAARGGAVGAGMVRGDIVEVNSRHLLQEYVHKNRYRARNSLLTAAAAAVMWNSVTCSSFQTTDIITLHLLHAPLTNQSSSSTC